MTAPDITRVSIVAGNEHRRPATDQDLLECADAYLWQKDPELKKGGPDALTRFMWRRTSEQLV